MNRIPHLLIIAIALCLASCSSPTKYIANPEPGLGHYGYSETRMDSMTYQVSFAGNYETTLDRVDQYALYRAAELTDSNGYDYFVVVHSQISTERRGRHREPNLTKTIRMYRAPTLPASLKPDRNSHTYNAKEMFGTMGSKIEREN